MNPRELEQIGPYPVVEFIAEGGMAWVFKVMDPRFKVHRALKMLKPQAAQGDEFRRFETEAKLLAQVEHPNLITIYDLAKDEATGCQYYTMTLVDGPTLATAETTDPWNAVDVFVDVLSALAKLHEQGIIHRDIKPGNILVTSDGRVLLGDLGIARQQDQLISLTRTGMAIGSVQYMSPEQARGSSISTSSDIFSIGLTLYQVLNGYTYYDAVEEVEATSGEQVLMYLGARIHSGLELKFVFPPNVPASLQAIIVRACRLDPNARYADAGEMKRALLAAKADKDKPPTHFPWKAIAITAFIAAALFGVFQLAGGPSPPDTLTLRAEYQKTLDLLQDPATTQAGKELAVGTLRSDPHPDATRVLMAATEDADPKVAVEALKALGNRVDDRVARHLVALLDSPVYQTRAYAARFLGQSGRVEALPALKRRLESEDHQAVQHWLNESIAILSPSPDGASDE